MPLQRVRGAESRIRNKLSNGPPRAQSNGDFQSILRRMDKRKLSEICWYLAKGMESYPCIRVAPRIVYSSLTD
jgi:hypothetical protein